MSTINWNIIASAIREGRLKDITPGEWKQVADKLDSLAPKKRGRPANPVHPDFVFDEASLNKAITKGKIFSEVLDTYNSLVSKGKKPTDAKAQTANMCRMSFKSVEKILTIYRPFVATKKKESE